MKITLFVLVCILIANNAFRVKHPSDRLRHNVGLRQLSDTPYFDEIAFDGVEIENEVLGYWRNEELLLDLFVSSSSQAKGLGLFVSSTEDQFIPAGEILCSYADDGAFVDDPRGDKTLLFYIDDVYETW